MCQNLSSSLKPIVRGSNIFLREANLGDSEFILMLRTDPERSAHISETEPDIEKQMDFMAHYFRSTADFYFIISDWENKPLGTVRLYNPGSDSFCWGSWLISTGAPASVAVESALLLYDFGFFSLHYRIARFDARKENTSVVRFHKRLGASCIGSNSRKLFFELTIEQHLSNRRKFERFLQPGWNP